METMRLSIQDPNWPNSEYLLESIVAAAKDANSGGGAFAFATSGGVKLLLEDHTFQEFLARGKFDLVVGVDAVTNVSALERIRASMGKYENLNARVFLSENSGGIFHPKFCWFRSKTQSEFLVGSGNLTVAGLRGNRECFSISRLSKGKSYQAHATWKSWLADNERYLLALDHADVIKRAKQNRRGEFQRPKSEDSVVEDNNGKIIVGVPKVGDAVLIAEIPRSGNRWNQANFDLNTFTEFFGATPGRTQRIILTNVTDTGEIRPEEIRPSIAVTSRNYRFELEAANGLNYPNEGRPIGVFVRVATRAFRYRLIMPGSKSHRSALEFLKKNTPQSERAVRRIITTASEVKLLDFYKGLGLADPRL